MKTPTIMPAVGLVVVIGCVIAGVLVVKRPAVQETTPPKTERTVQTGNQTTPVAAPLTPAVTQASPPEVVAAPTTEPVKETNVQPPATAQTTSQQPPAADIQDPGARVALSFVGVDRNAEEYWAEAINNPNLPADERRELIEDLNQDGFSDPHNPGAQDLPLILNRLRMIEGLAPNAMDQVNYDAFIEAYKDLVNMLRGQPIQ